MMKKLTLLAITVLLAFSVQAQTTKGTVVLTGKAGYNQSKSKNDRSEDTPISEFENYNYTVSPSIGFLITDNLEIGAAAHTYRYVSEDIRYNEGVSNSWEWSQKDEGVSVYARQYKYLTEKMALHGTLSVGVSYLENSYKSSNSHEIYKHSSIHVYDNTSLTGSFSPGLTFFASSKLGFTASLGALKFNHITTNAATERTDYFISPDFLERKEFTTKKNVLQFDFSSLHLNFGIAYYLGK